MATRNALARAGLTLALLLAPHGPVEGQDIAGAAKRAAAARVRPGDRILLHFLRERELSDSLYVNERGESAFPKIGLLRVSDMTIGELQDTLRARYSEFFRLPELQIAVLRRVVVNGEVRMPNVFLVDGSFTVRDVIARAGGVTDAGNKNKVFIIRGGDRIPVKHWDRETAEGADVQSGDQIVVGRRSWLSMNALSLVSTGILVASFVISVSR